MVDRDAPYSGLASIMAMNGRYGDTELVHMSKPEIRGLASIGELTINPETGLPEAFNLSSLLPIALNIGLGVATGGMSTMGQMALMGAVNFGLGKATGKSTKDALFDGAFAAAGSGLSRAVGIGGSGSSAVKGGGKGGGTAGAGAGTDALSSLGTEAIVGNSVSSGAVNTAPSSTALSSYVPNASELVGGSEGVASAYGNAVNNAVAPSSSLMDVIKKHPFKTAAGIGGLGALLPSGDEQYPEEEPKEIEKLPQFTLEGADPIDRKYTEEGLVDLYTRGAAGDPERESQFNYFTRPEYELRPSELNTGGLVGLDDNKRTSQSSGVGNFLQPEQGNNNVITQQGIMDNMFALGAAAGKADEEKGVQSLAAPVDVVAPTGDANRLRLELLGDGKHRYVRDETPTVQELVEVNPVPDTVEELSDNAEDQAEGFSHQNMDPYGMTGRGFSQGWDSNPKTDIQIPYFYEAHPARSTVTQKDIDAYNAAKSDIAFSNPQTQAAMAIGYDATMGPSAGGPSGPSDGGAGGSGDDTEGVGEGQDGSEGPPAATGGLISMLKKAEGGIVSLAEGKRPRPKDEHPLLKKKEDVINNILPFIKEQEGFLKVITEAVEGRNKKGKQTYDIGYGHKLSNKEYKNKKVYGFDVSGKISKEIASEIAKKDLIKKYDLISQDVNNIKNEKKLSKDTRSFENLNILEQSALLDMSFNLGSVKTFPKFVSGVLTKDPDALESEYKRYTVDSDTGIKKTLGRNKSFYKDYVKPLIKSFTNKATTESLSLEEASGLASIDTPEQQARPRPKVKPEPPEQQVAAEDLISRSGIMQYPRTAKDTSYKGGIEGLEGGSFLEKIREYIPFSEGGTLEQYYQGQVIGKGDGMSDEILFDVEGRNPDMALLSRDEYVIPADVVSMIGNGSSNAGAEELDSFLKNVRQQSFGTRKQQREMTNPQKGLSALV